jgi:hypothetical protein
MKAVLVRGIVTALGDMIPEGGQRDDEGSNGLLIRRYAGTEGQDIMITGLTEEEVRSLAPMLFEEVELELTK